MDTNETATHRLGFPSGLHPHLLYSRTRQRSRHLFQPSFPVITDRVVTAETISSLQAFRKRHGEAQRIHAQYASQPTTVDLAHYRSILKNQAVVDDVAKLLADFKPVTYDVSAHVKAIETFEATAVAKAKETVEKVDIELKD